MVESINELLQWELGSDFKIQSRERPKRIISWASKEMQNCDSVPRNQHKENNLTAGCTCLLSFIVDTAVFTWLVIFTLWTQRGELLTSCWLKGRSIQALVLVPWGDALHTQNFGIRASSWLSLWHSPTVVSKWWSAKNFYSSYKKCAYRVYLNLVWNCYNWINEIKRNGWVKLEHKQQPWQY